MPMVRVPGEGNDLEFPTEPLCAPPHAGHVSGPGVGGVSPSIMP